MLVKMCHIQKKNIKYFDYITRLFRLGPSLSDKNQKLANSPSPIVRKNEKLANPSSPPCQKKSETGWLPPHPSGADIICERPLHDFLFFLLTAFTLHVYDI